MSESDPTAELPHQPAADEELPTMVALDALESDLDRIDAALERLDRDP